MDRALSGKMTATSLSLMFSGSFVTLLIWGCTIADSLVNEQPALQPATTIGYQSIKPTTFDNPYGDTMPSACGNISHHCMDFCKTCHDFFGGPTQLCLSGLYTHICLSNFQHGMELLNSTDWCIWGNVRSLYSNLSLCTEDISDCLLIPWPNRLVEETFVDIHSRFFKDCPTEELSDPPPVIVFALVITPICLIPVMVSLVVLKTKNGDGSS